MFCQLFSLQNKSFLCLQYVENKGFQTVIKHRLKAIQKHIKNELGNREKNTENAHFVLKKCTFRFRDYIYWTQLFGKDFKRDRCGDSPNVLLNYGYSILRAATARALLGSGLLPNLGIFHKSRYNAFPLADDVMEPYRPYVDSIVFNLYADGITELNKDSKMEIMRLLSCDVKIGKVMRPLQIALTFTTASLVKFYAGEIKKISLPFIL